MALKQHYMDIMNKTGEFAGSGASLAISFIVTFLKKIYFITHSFYYILMSTLLRERWDLIDHIFHICDHLFPPLRILTAAIAGFWDTFKMIFKKDVPLHQRIGIIILSAATVAAFAISLAIPHLTFIMLLSSSFFALGKDLIKTTLIDLWKNHRAIQAKRLAIKREQNEPTPNQDTLTRLQQELDELKQARRKLIGKTLDNIVRGCISMLVIGGIATTAIPGPLAFLIGASILGVASLITTSYFVTKEIFKYRKRKRKQIGLAETADTRAEETLEEVIMQAAINNNILYRNQATPKEQSLTQLPEAQPAVTTHLYNQSVPMTSNTTRATTDTAGSPQKTNHYAHIMKQMLSKRDNPIVPLTNIIPQLPHIVSYPINVPQTTTRPTAKRAHPATKNPITKPRNEVTSLGKSRFSTFANPPTTQQNECEFPAVLSQQTTAVHPQAQAGLTQ